MTRKPLSMYRIEACIQVRVSLKWKRTRAPNALDFSIVV
jgi:hypothetical protein